MTLHSKFSVGDRVYTITTQRKTERDPCGVCEGTGRLKEDYRCPKCGGDGTVFTDRHFDDYSIISLTLAQVRIETTGFKSGLVFDNIGNIDMDNLHTEVHYMALETGVKSGTLWREESLYATGEEAEAEIARRKEVMK